MATTLEVIDPAGDVDRQLDALDRACRTVGFFRVPFDVVDPAVRDRAWADAARFFAQPQAAKAAVAFPEVGYPYGYAPFEYETLAASDGTASAAYGTASAPDLKESFSVGPDCMGPARPGVGADDSVDDPGEAWLRSPSLWPEEPSSLRESWGACYRALAAVASDLLSMMASALGMPADHFAPLIDRHSSAMRVNHYPALTGPIPPGALRAGAHTDYGTLTILRTDGVPGLEVRRPDGDWVAVADEPGTFVVNLGDSIAQWTNDRWRSTRHRVRPVDPRPRMSMAFFHMANWDARIECLPTCLAPGQRPRHEPVQAGPWLMSKFQRTVG